MLAKSDVAIVGVGGLGSHIVQQLSHLGIGALTLIDPDLLEEHNLNRLIGACTSDLAARTSKVKIAARLTNAIDPSIAVVPIPADLRSQESLNAIMRSSCVFGCVDNDGARLVLNEVSCAYEIPYIDLATDVVPDRDLVFGGRVFVNSDEHGCLFCQGEISPKLASLDLTSDAGKKDRGDIYGVKVDELGDSGPSVVSINGVIASLGVTEFMVMTVGLRPANRFLQYYGNRNESIITTRVPSPNTDCYYCKGLRGKRDRANIQRYWMENV